MARWHSTTTTPPPRYIALITFRRGEYCFAAEKGRCGGERGKRAVRTYRMRPVAATLNFNDNLFDETGRRYSLARISPGGPGVAGNFLITTHFRKYSSNENSIRHRGRARGTNFVRLSSRGNFRFSDLRGDSLRSRIAASTSLHRRIQRSISQRSPRFSFHKNLRSHYLISNSH